MTQTEESYRFIFVHGYGTSPKDFGKLPILLSAEGHRVDILTLPDHYDYDDAFYSPRIVDYESFLDTAIEKVNFQGEKIILVGFSLGATLCLGVSGRHDIHGAILFSTFLGVSGWKEVLLSCSPKFLDKFRIRRRLNVTRKETSSVLKSSEFLSVGGVKAVHHYARNISKEQHGRQTALLFFNSVDDRVSSYQRVLDYSKKCDRVIDFVTLFSINHFIIHDINPTDVCNFILDTFEIKNRNHQRLSKDESKFQFYLI